MDYLEKIREGIAKCTLDSELARQLGVTIEEISRRKSQLYKHFKIGLENKTCEEEYLDYYWQQKECIRQLDEIIENYKDTRHQGMVITAIRIKSDIIDKIYKKGAELGLFGEAKRKKTKLQKMSIKELEKHLENQLLKFQATVRRAIEIEERMDIETEASESYPEIPS